MSDTPSSSELPREARPRRPTSMRDERRLLPPQPLHLASPGGLEEPAMAPLAPSPRSSAPAPEPADGTLNSVAAAGEQTSQCAASPIRLAAPHSSQDVRERPPPGHVQVRLRAAG